MHYLKNANFFRKRGKDNKRQNTYIDINNLFCDKKII